MKTHLLFVFLTFSIIVNAQWQDTHPVSAQMNCVAVNGTTVFAGRAGGGVEGSLDNGNSWTMCCHNGMANPYIWSLMTDGTNVLAATSGGVYLSTDHAATWVPKSIGFSATNSGSDTLVMSLVKSGANLFAGTGGNGIYLSTNYGSSWNAVNTGLTNQTVKALCVSGVNVFAGTIGGGMFLSNTNGSNWNAINTGLTNGNITTIVIDGTNIYAGTSGGGVFLSSNNGTNWTAINNGLLNLTVRSLVISGGNVFAGTAGGVYFSKNNGSTWSADNNGFTSSDINRLAINGTTIFASIGLNGVWKRSLSEIVGIKEIEIEKQLRVFPNPFSSSTTFQIDNPLQNATFTVENYLGQTVKQIKNINGRLIILDRDNLPGGLYFIRLTEDTKIIATRKIIITD